MTLMTSHNERWQQLLLTYWADYKAEYPHCVSEFDRSFACDFAKEGIADFERRHEWVGTVLSKLSEIEIDALPPHDRISYQVLKQNLQQLQDYCELEGYLRPALFPFGPEMLISFYSVDKTTLLSREDAIDYLARIKRFPSLFEDMQNRLQQGLEKGYALPAVLLTPVIKNILAYTDTSEEDSSWYQPFKSRHIATLSDIDELQAQAKHAIKEKIRPAYQHFVHYLREHYAAHCTESNACTDQPNGREYYQLLIRYHTSLDLAPEDIHDIGLDEVSRIHNEIVAVAKEAGYPNDLKGFQQFVGNDPQSFLADKETLRARIESLSKRIDRLIPQYFSRIPRMTYGVESFPEAVAAQRPIAMAQANPADGSASGIHWITSLPARCPTYLHIPLVLHEGWPGHLMHMALMQEIDSLPMFRRINFDDYNAYIEGWALYCERLGLDMGLYQTPIEHYGRLDMEIQRAIRLVVDTGIHAMGWSRQQAIEYMQNYLVQPEASIEAEVDRYIGNPGQALSYKLGELKIRELRQRAEDALGDEFVLKDFHDCVLSTGPVTLNILDKEVQRWIDKKQGSAQ